MEGRGCGGDCVCAVQAFCSSITGMLATLAILKGVGVGDSSATPLAAALTWMFKGTDAHME